MKEYFYIVFSIFFSTVYPRSLPLPLNQLCIYNIVDTVSTYTG